MRRLFIALDLDERTKAQIASLVAALTNQLRDAGRISWVQPARWHLTLRFLGDVGSGFVGPLTAAVSEPFSSSPFAIELRGLGTFPPSGVPRVLWLGLADGGEQVITLRRNVDERLCEIGIPPEQAAFSPHLTLARFRDRGSRRGLRNLHAVLQHLQQGSDPGTGTGVGPLVCQIDRVTLYESKLSSAGPSYTTIAQALLQP